MRVVRNAAFLQTTMRRAAFAIAIAVSCKAFAFRPNDFVAQQLSFHQIRAVEAWNYATGTNGSGVLVAVLDSGVDATHPDLAPNMYVNTAEIASNGIDDDNDGYVDDVQGWNFLENSRDTSDHLGRGTHLAGVIAAVGNNGKGVAGICWGCRILPVKVLGDDVGAFEVKPQMGADAIRYAADRGASVIDVSFYSGNSPILKEAVQYAVDKGAIVIAAAGDQSADLDAHPVYPAAWDIDGMISVANVDQGAKIALSSNFGFKTVTMVAPGVNVFSTLPGGFVGRMTGTAQAAAHVAGAAALMKAMHPTMTGKQIAESIQRLSSNRGILKHTVKTEAILDLGYLVAEKRQTVDAHILCPDKVKPGELVVMDGSSSEGPIIEYLWKFGDPWDEFGKVVPHKWDRPGSVRVELQVRTGDGRTASIDKTIRIEGDEWIPGVCEAGPRATGTSAAGALALLLLALAPALVALRASRIR